MLSTQLNRYVVRSVSFLKLISQGAILSLISLIWTGICGTSHSSLWVLAFAIAFGLYVARLTAASLPETWIRTRRVSRTSVVSGLMLSVLIWLLPEMFEATLLAGCETFGTESPLTRIMALTFPMFTVIGICIPMGVFQRTATPTDDSRDWISIVLKGTLGAGSLFIPMMFPVSPTGVIVILIAVTVTTGAGCRRLLRPDGVPAGDSESETRAVADGRSWLHWFSAGILVCPGLTILGGLLPLNLPTLLIAGICSATALMILTSRFSLKLFRAEGLLAAAILCLVSLACFTESFAALNLRMTSGVSSAVIIILLRAVQAGALLTAIALPVVLSAKRTRYAAKWYAGLPESLLLIGGCLLAYLGLNYGAVPAWLIALGIIGHIAAAWRSTVYGVLAREIPIRLRGISVRVSGAALLLPLAFLPLCFPGNESELARISVEVFSPRTVAAIERGVERELIAESDANRLITAVQRAGGEVSLWRRAGNILEFYRNGVSLGKISCDTSIAPQPPEDVLPLVMAIAGHPHPSRLLLLGDETGAGLRSCAHFPIPEIVAVRSDPAITQLASQYVWSSEQVPADRDDRVTIVHGPATLALMDRRHGHFDVVVASTSAPDSFPGAADYTTEYYRSVRSRMRDDGLFAQRFRQSGLGPESLRRTLVTLQTSFAYVGAVHLVPGEILLLATNASHGLIEPGFPGRLRKDHVRLEIAQTGWDWSQAATLPLVDANDPIGIFSQEKPPEPNAVHRGEFAMWFPFEKARRADKTAELRDTFAPHQMQLLVAVPYSEDHAEVARRLSLLTQQTEILSGMPDEPWTYRKSLRMEMQRNPRPPQEIVRDGTVVRTSHELDVFNRDYFSVLGKALSAAARSELTLNDLGSLERFTSTPEPLLSHFAHYEIVRLHELAKNPAPQDEFRHRLHTVFYTSPTDASVRPVIAAIEQLVEQPELITDDVARYDMLNSLVQKLIERWEARTTWEPRSALRVQNDVDQSVRMANRALDQMEQMSEVAGVEHTRFLKRRRYINAALITPLRAYRDQVLAHRMKHESPSIPNTEDPDDLPLLIQPPNEMLTN